MTSLGEDYTQHQDFLSPEEIFRANVFSFGNFR